MPDGFPSFGGWTETGVVPAKTHAIERPSFSYCIPRLSLSVKRFALCAAALPTALPLFATGLGALGLLGWRRKRKAQVD